jgi:hypothetical protein
MTQFAVAHWSGFRIAAKSWRNPHQIINPGQIIFRRLNPQTVHADRSSLTTSKAAHDCRLQRLSLPLAHRGRQNGSGVCAFVHAGRAANCRHSSAPAPVATGNGLGRRGSGTRVTQGGLHVHKRDVAVRLEKVLPTKIGYPLLHSHGRCR